MRRAVESGSEEEHDDGSRRRAGGPMVSLIELARERSRAEFVLVVPRHFLLLDAALRDPALVAFVTRIARLSSRPSAVSDTQQPRIVAVAKAPGHPYPDRIGVGRARNCDIVLRDPSVSKLHAQFCVAGAALALVDIGSHNGTRINGRRLLRDRPTPLVPGDHVAFGDVATRLLDAALLYDLLRTR
jgi:hypothetical protein